MEFDNLEKYKESRRNLRILTVLERPATHLVQPKKSGRVSSAGGSTLRSAKLNIE